MKSINYIINGVLVIAVAALFFMHFSSKKGGAKDAVSGSDSLGIQLPVAYVNGDSILHNYNYSMDMNEEYLRKAENLRANLNQRASNFQAEYVEFQKKVENNAFLTRERMEQEASRLQRKQQSLEQESQKMQMELAQEQQKKNEQLRDSIVSCLKIFNESKKYQMILTGEAILYGEKTYDITAEVIEFLNSRYKPAAEPVKK